MSEAGQRVSFVYRHVAHVEDLKEGQTEDDFRAGVIDRYRRLDAKRDGIEDVPVLVTKEIPKPKRPPPAASVDESVADPDTGEPQVTLEADFRVIKAKGIGWFNVVDGAGVPANHKALRKADADAMAVQMNDAGNPSHHEAGF